jgi:glycosyltransferase involved in cell wall biosynthesis
LRDVDVEESVCPLLLPANISEALRPPLPPYAEHGLPVYPLPADVLLPPSLWVASRDTVTRAAHPVAVIPPMVDTATFDPQLATCPLSQRGIFTRMEDGVPVNDVTVVGTAGRLAPEKHMGLLIAAYAAARRRIAATGRHARLLLVGRHDTQDYADGLRRLAAAVGIPDDEVWCPPPCVSVCARETVCVRASVCVCLSVSVCLRASLCGDRLACTWFLDSVGANDVSVGVCD